MTRDELGRGEHAQSRVKRSQSGEETSAARKRLKQRGVVRLRRARTARRSMPSYILPLRVYVTAIQFGTLVVDDWALYRTDLLKMKWLPPF